MDSFHYNKTRKVYAAMPVQKDDQKYNMKHQNRGQVLIFNNADSMMAETAERDVKNFKTMCKEIGFLDNQIKYYKNRELKEIRNIVYAFANEDHKEEDCVLVVCISCEKNSRYLYETYILPQLYADECPSLAGKPKLIFFQVYERSQKQDEGGNLPQWQKQASDVDLTYKIPTSVDFLFVNNTSPANPAQGSVFYMYLSEFCKSLKENKTDPEDCDLLSVLTNVIDEASRDAPREAQVLTSTLIRDVCFHQSSLMN